MRASHLAMLPHLPEDSRFSRRAAQVRFLLEDLRRSILFWADADLETIRILDSYPMPLCACYRIRQSALPISSSAFGYNDSKRMWYFGLRPGIFITGSGFVEDITLFAGNCNNTPTLTRCLDGRIVRGIDVPGQEWIVDKGFVNAQLAKWAKEKLDLNLLARQEDRKGQEPDFFQVLIDKIGEPIEGVISVLTECFGLDHILARSDVRLFRRTQARATAFTLARYFNQVLGRPPMNIAAYAI